jgi:hypothetical protein
MGKPPGNRIRTKQRCALLYMSPPEAFVGVGTDGMYDTTFFSAPDVTVGSLGRQGGGQPTDGTADGLLFFADVEDNNQSLPALIRRLGVLLVNFRNLNGVLASEPGYLFCE